MGRKLKVHFGRSIPGLLGALWQADCVGPLDLVYSFRTEPDSQQLSSFQSMTAGGTTEITGWFIFCTLLPLLFLLRLWCAGNDTALIASCGSSVFTLTRV